MHRALCARMFSFVSLALIVVPTSARAYRTFADLPELAEGDGQPIAWDAFPIELEVYAPEDAPADADATLEAVERAVQTWNDAMCTEDIFAGAVMTDLLASNDGFNTVQWVTLNWEAIGDADALAMTEPVYARRGGRYVLIEADIFLNGDTVIWSDDLLEHLDGVLAHELGHALGLAHPCEPDGRAGAPSCEHDDALSLMHPQYDPARAELTADDEAGACFLYPGGPLEMPPAASEAAGGGCSAASVGARSQHSTALPALIALGWLATRRRRRAAPAQSSCSQWS